MKIGILQTGRSPDVLVGKYGEYGDMFARMLGGRGFAFTVYDVLEHEFPTTASEMDGWLITGSKFGVYEGHDWIEPLEQLIRDIHAAGLPLVGVCFGHQAVAQALGGKVEKFSGGWSVGRVEYRIGNGESLPLHAWHQDQVVEKPENARTIGSTDFCKHAILAYGDAILTMQPHPEFDAGFIEGLANSRGRGVVPDLLLDAAVAGLGKDVAKGKVADTFEKLFKDNYKGGENHG
ncbi:MAG: type 1 glutamine amidotransferase [Rhodobacteraceae bacterium]|nr:type 1 glutamine amidotransferase [Paracoccaceae bacterium]